MGPCNVLEGRITAAGVHTRQAGWIVFYSIYLTTVVQDGHENVSAVIALIQHAASHGWPWVAGMDWNIAP